jgi:O-antigen/teichoic acid export membrane protein
MKRITLETPAPYPFPFLKSALARTALMRLRSMAPPLFAVLEPSLQKRMASGALWAVFGAGTASGLAMLSNIGCARILGSIRFGELGIVLVTINLFTNVFTAGLGLTATRYVAELRNTQPTRAGAVIGLSNATSAIAGMLIAGAISFLAPWASNDLLNAPNLSTPLRIGAAVMFFAAINGSQTGTLSGFEAFNQIALGNLIRGISILVLVTTGAWLRGLSGALLGYVAVGAVTAVFYQIAVRRECKRHLVSISYRFDRKAITLLWRFTIPVLLSNSSFTPAAWWSNVLLARRSGYAEAGIFNAVYNWQMFITFISTAVSSIGLPMLSNVRSEGNPRKYKQCLKSNFVLISLPAVMLAIPVMLMSKYILQMYGTAFAHGVPALLLIAVSAVLTSINLPVGHAIWSLDATVAAMLLSLLNGATLVLVAYVLTPHGAAGLAAAYVFMGLVQTAANAPFTLWLLRKRLGRAYEAESVAA